MSMKKSNDTIRNRIRNLPACSAVASIYMEVLNIFFVGALFMEEWEKWGSGGCSLDEFCTAADLWGTDLTIIHEESVAMCSWRKGSVS
jgi:hypothetical protein